MPLVALGPQVPQQAAEYLSKVRQVAFGSWQLKVVVCGCCGLLLVMGKWESQQGRLYTQP